MSDNIQVTPGSGANVSTEEVTSLNGGSVSAQHVQRIAMARITADGTAVDVTTSTPMPVVGTITLPSGAAADATISTMSAKLPASLGIKSAANSISVAPASDASFNIDTSLQSSTASASAPSMNTSSVTVISANTSRKGVVIYNPLAGALLVNLAGGTANATSAHARITQYSSFELPAGYTGAVTGTLESGSGTISVVQFT